MLVMLASSRSMTSAMMTTARIAHMVRVESAVLERDVSMVVVSFLIMTAGRARRGATVAACPALR